MVKTNGSYSGDYNVERGVKQGSVLSPVLFLIVMDPLLKKLEESAGFGLSLYDYYAGGYLHADDIRTLATSCDSLEKQASVVSDFVEKNFLKLNRKKCEVVAFSKSNNSAWLMDVLCQWEMLGNVLAFGGREIYLLLNVLMKTSGRPEKHFLGMAALVLFREVLVLSPQYQLLRPVYFLPYCMGLRIGF